MMHVSNHRLLLLPLILVLQSAWRALGEADCCGSMISLCCHNNGKCLSEQSEAGEITYCKCKNGWGDMTCQTQMKTKTCPDGKTRCLNGSTCSAAEARDGSGTDSEYSCDCSKAQGGIFAGLQCEYEAFDKCHEKKNATHFCANGGRCKQYHSPDDESPHKGCTCHKNFYGDNCELAVQQLTTAMGGTSDAISSDGSGHAGPAIPMKMVVLIFFLSAFFCVCFSACMFKRLGVGGSAGRGGATTTKQDIVEEGNL